MTRKQTIALLIVSVFLIASVAGSTGSSFSQETIINSVPKPEQNESLVFPVMNQISIKCGGFF